MRGSYSGMNLPWWQVMWVWAYARCWWLGCGWLGCRFLLPVTVPLMSLALCFIKALRSIKPLRFLLAGLLCFYTEIPRCFFGRRYSQHPRLNVTIHTFPWKMRIEKCPLSCQYGILPGNSLDVYGQTCKKLEKKDRRNKTLECWLAKLDASSAIMSRALEQTNDVRKRVSQKLHQSSPLFACMVTLFLNGRRYSQHPRCNNSHFALENEGCKMSLVFSHRGSQHWFGSKHENKSVRETVNTWGFTKSSANLTAKKSLKRTNQVPGNKKLNWRLTLDTNLASRLAMAVHRHQTDLVRSSVF